MAALRDLINDTLKETEPFKVVSGTIATAAAAGIAYKLLTSEENLKMVVGRALFKAIRAIPGAEGKITQEREKMLKKIERDLDVIHEPKYKSIPSHGLTPEETLNHMKACMAHDAKWNEGKVSGAVYAGDETHVKLLSDVYALFSQTNPLHADVFPSVRKFEAEIIAMTASMLHGTPETVGAVTSGGTESILMALKAYRDHARKVRPDIKVPEVVAPLSVHPAFDKGCHYFGIKLVHVPVGPDYRADVKAMRRAIGPNTILIVGSTPSFPHGMIDPIPEIAALAKEFGIPLHVDACLGGFLLPWMKKLGYPDIPEFDFTLPEVTSMTADTHKYGYASKGTSVVLFRNPELRHCMYFVQTDWTGGIYASPTMAGSRPGGLVAACYASLISVGEEGYLTHSDRIAKASQRIAQGLREIPGISLIGDPKAQVIAFTSSRFDIFKLMDALKKTGWVLNALQRPNALHLCVTQRHVDVAEDFLRDVREACEILNKNPSLYPDGATAIYGLAAAIPERALVGDIINGVLDVMLKA